MAVTYKPERYDLPELVAGDTLDPINITLDGTDSTLTGVALTVFGAGSSTAVMTKTAGSGITVNDATAGGWDIDIDEIEAVPLAPGMYSIFITFTDATGRIRTYLAGKWRIIPKAHT